MAEMTINTQNKRRSYRYKLTEDWLRVHRPDVWQAIQDEVNKAYPLPKTEAARIELPVALANLK